MTAKETFEEIEKVSYEIRCVLNGEESNLCICALGIVLSEIIYQREKDPLRCRKILRKFYEAALSTLEGLGKNNNKEREECHEPI
jgi:hypothetical protein